MMARAELKQRIAGDTVHILIGESDWEAGWQVDLPCRFMRVFDEVQQ